MKLIILLAAVLSCNAAAPTSNPIGFTFGVNNLAYMPGKPWMFQQDYGTFEGNYITKVHIDNTTVANGSPMVPYDPLPSWNSPLYDEVSDNVYYTYSSNITGDVWVGCWGRSTKKECLPPVRISQYPTYIRWKLGWGNTLPNQCVKWKDALWCKGNNYFSGNSTLYTISLTGAKGVGTIKVIDASYAPDLYTNGNFMSYGAQDPDTGKIYYSGLGAHVLQYDLLTGLPGPVYNLTCPNNGVGCGVADVKFSTKTKEVFVYAYSAINTLTNNRTIYKVNPENNNGMLEFFALCELPPAAVAYGMYDFSQPLVLNEERGIMLVFATAQYSSGWQHGRLGGMSIIFSISVSTGHVSVTTKEFPNFKPWEETLPTPSTERWWSIN
eukprot:gene12942-3789_t